MELSDQDIALLEQFQNGEISRQTASEKMEGFDDKLSAYQTSLEAIEAWGDEQLKEKLNKQYHQHKQEAAKIVSFPQWGKYAVAASVLIAALSLIFLLLKKDTPSSGPELYAANYEMLELPWANIRSDIRKDSLMLMAKSFYNERRFEEALEIFQQIFHNDSLDVSMNTETEITIGYAYTQMELKNYEEATAALEEVNEYFPDYYECRWQLALAYLALDKTDKARGILMGLAENSKAFKKDAKKLLKQLP
ncbi:MAG: tetratricopeptide repeat protein [Bacteroidota bacterium]